MEELLIEALKSSDGTLKISNGTRWMYWDLDHWVVRQHRMTKSVVRTEDLGKALKALLES